MKKIITMCLMALVSLSALAQTQPNRMLVVNNHGQYKGYLVERVDSVVFKTIEGRVAADVTFKKFESKADGDVITVSVKRTQDCKTFRLTVLPKNLADKIGNDETAENYFERTGGTLYGEDFDNGEIRGFEQPFPANADYTVLTLGYDEYGIACSMSKANFKTPAKPLVGNPHVEGVTNNVGTDRFTMTFTPNGDVGGYAYCVFPKGTATQQFEQFGPMMGYATFGDMIRGFCQNSYSTEHTNEWTSMEPGKEYEVVVQAWDKENTDAEPQYFYVTTKSLGGDGVATVSIEIKEFSSNGQGGYVQRVIYTPNDQAALHRDMIIVKSAFEGPEWGDEGVKKYLKDDNNPDPQWNQYGVDDAYWNADPSTTYLACSMARNAKGEWGELVKKEFTTPASASSSAPAGKAGRYASYSVTNGVAKFGTKGVNNEKPSIRLEHK